MEAKTFQKKKPNINKGKLKKTIKNVLCRPDVPFWPVIKEDQAFTLKSALEKYKVDVPIFDKPHWKDLKDIPKASRPKPPKVKKPDGLHFGVSECNNAIQSDDCAAVIVEASVNPRIIIQPLLGKCLTNKIPVICLNEIRKLTLECYGIPTSSLGIKKDKFPDLVHEIKRLSCPLLPVQTSIESNDVVQDKERKTKPESLSMEIDTSVSSTNFHLLRKDKKTRAFVPPTGAGTVNPKREFIGQDFIEFADEPPKKMARKEYLKMTLKKISSNQKRTKVKGS